MNTPTPPNAPPLPSLPPPHHVTSHTTDMDVDVSPLVVSAPTVASKLPVAVVTEAAASKANR